MKREEIIAKIEHDNDRRILFQTAMPHVLDILNKYNGKQYGEKTKEKMSKELKEKCNCALYLYNGWHEDISIVPLNTEGFTDHHFKYSDFNIYVKYPKRDTIRPLGDDNKIHGGFSFEDFTLSDCHEYVYDVAAHADNIIASFEVLKERQEELQRNITIFNNMLPSGIENKHIATFRNYL